jgi:hypothetical protein
MRQDYTLFEHARDLAGAARWNAAAMIHRKDPAGYAALVPPARPAPGPDLAAAEEVSDVVGAETRSGA